MAPVVTLGLPPASARRRAAGELYNHRVSGAGDALGEIAKALQGAGLRAVVAFYKGRQLGAAWAYGRRFSAARRGVCPAAVRIGSVGLAPLAKCLTYNTKSRMLRRVELL